MGPKSLLLFDKPPKGSELSTKEWKTPFRHIVPRDPSRVRQPGASPALPSAPSMFTVENVSVDVSITPTLFWFEGTNTTSLPEKVSTSSSSHTPYTVSISTHTHLLPSHGLVSQRAPGGMPFFLFWDFFSFSSGWGEKEEED